jgi:hypothetical protein
MLNTTIIRPRILHRKRSPKILRKLASDRDAWLAQIPSWGLFHRIFDEIPGYYFFAKDRKGRAMVTSQSVLDRYQMTNEEEMLGFTDYDINPQSMAEGYAQDDKRLLDGEVDRIEHMELWFDKQGMPDWYIITKLPVSAGLRNKREICRFWKASPRQSWLFARNFPETFPCWT